MSSPPCWRKCALAQFAQAYLWVQNPYFKSLATSEFLLRRKRQGALPMNAGAPSMIPQAIACANRWASAAARVCRRLTKAAFGGIGKSAFTLVIGQYAQSWHLPGHMDKPLTERVRRWREFGAGLIPLPHPSPRNGLWLRDNPWFAEEVIPAIRQRVADALELR